MQLFGFGSIENIEIKNLHLSAETVKIGEDLAFSFELHNNSIKTEKVRLEYGIYYLKQNATLSKKVYKISEKDYVPKSATTINRRQSFKVISTRKFHTGQHVLSLIINGVEVEERAFELTEH